MEKSASIFAQQAGTKVAPNVGLESQRIFFGRNWKVGSHGTRTSPTLEKSKERRIPGKRNHWMEEFDEGGIPGRRNPRKEESMKKD